MTGKGGQIGPPWPPLNGREKTGPNNYLETRLASEV